MAAATPAKVLAVPQGAINSDASGDLSVIVQAADKALTRIPVEVGVTGDNLVEVTPKTPDSLQGRQGGDRRLIDHAAQAVQDGQHVIVLDEVERTYPGPAPVHAVRPVDLVIHRGEFAAIVGPSGSGKSTLLNVLGLLDSPTAGRDVLDGYVVLDSEQLPDGSTPARPERLEHPDRSLGPHQAYAFQWWMSMPVGLLLIWLGLRRELREEDPSRQVKPKKVRIWDEEDY